MIHLNKDLMEKQGLSNIDEEALDLLYKQMLEYISFPEKHENIVDLVREQEFKIQDAWKFDRDIKYHYYQFKIKNCQCPVYENYERVGKTEERWMNTNCPWHGDKSSEKKVDNR